MKNWSKSWNSSKKPAKQRKYRFQSPLNIKQKFMHVNLCKPLRDKHNLRQILVRKGDKVQIVRGQQKKKSGIVNRVSLIRGRVFIEGIENKRQEGQSGMIGFQPSNLVIMELNLEDKKRKAKLEKKVKIQEKKK